MPATCPLVQRGDRPCIDTDEILRREVRFLRALKSCFAPPTPEPLPPSSKAIDLMAKGSAETWRTSSRRMAGIYS
jgi:hypothetical protein